MRASEKDRIGFRGNDHNLYRYVFNDPLRRIDPTGQVSAFEAGLYAGGAAFLAKGILGATLGKETPRQAFAEAMPVGLLFGLVTSFGAAAIAAGVSAGAMSEALEPLTHPLCIELWGYAHIEEILKKVGLRP